MLVVVGLNGGVYCDYQEETFVKRSGKRALLKAGHFSLARVTTILGKRRHATNEAGAQTEDDGDIDSEPFMDDYIAHDEPIAAYLTRWSGIFPGDLDPAVSPYYVTTLKSAYLKLRYLVDKGCVFVGHGLDKDFRIIST